MAKANKREKQRKKHLNTNTTTPSETQSSNQFLILSGVTGCFFLSGFAALLYQTAWMRQFSVVFGTSELAIATVLSSYMAGLALGAALAARYVHRITRPILVYGILEAAIAISALAVPYLLKFSGLLYAWLLGGQANPPDASGLGQSMFYLLVAFLVLLVPTASMGATLPLLTKYVVRTKEQIGPRVGMLYAINTFGAIGGTLVAAFLLLPKLGLMGTIWVGAGVNLLVFYIAATLAKSIRKTQTDEKDEIQAPSAMPRLNFKDRGPSWILPIMLLSGANTFTYEVLWTRLLSHILGGSISAFAAMLASFLGGIAIGSAIAARIAKTFNLSFYGFISTQLGIALTSAIIYQSLGSVAPETAGLQANIGLAILILLPATLFIGATFPFAVRLLAHNETDAPQSSARVYAWNTSGAIVGAAVAGFILIPMLKYEGAIKMAVLVNLALASLSCFLIQTKHYAIPTATVAVTVLALIMYKPEWPEQILRISPLNDSNLGEISFYDVGRTSTVLILERDGYFYLRNNGLSEASSDLKGAPPARHSQRLLSTLPFIARPQAKEMLIIGLGGGVALENVTPSIKNIDVLELEPKVIDANKSIGDKRNFNPLTDPRIKIYINDARSALQLTDKKYDIIVSQPSHPWTAGASHLYTREFMQLAHEHLTEPGVYLQWMNSLFVSKKLLRSFCRTLLDVFPYVRVYQWYPGTLFFLGSDKPLDIETQMAQTGIPLTQDIQHYLEKGIGSEEDLLTGLMMDENSIKRFASEAAIITDDFNLMATSSGMRPGKGKTLSNRDIKNLVMQYSPVFQNDSWVHKDFPKTLNFAYMGDRFEQNTSADLKEKLAKVLYEFKDPQSLTLAGKILLKNNQFEKGRDALLTALKTNPEDHQSRFLLLWQYKDQLAEGTAPQIIQDELPKLTASARATVEAWPVSTKNGDSTYAFKLESELAQTKPTDQWFLPATKLRVDWRIQHPDEDQHVQHGQEAMQIIDNAISIYQDLEFYGMRIAASYLADKPYAVFETARRMIQNMRQDLYYSRNQDLSFSANQIQKNLVKINSLSVGLMKLQDANSIQQNKLEDLRVQIEMLINEYQTYAKGLKIKKLK